MHPVLCGALLTCSYLLHFCAMAVTRALPVAARLWMQCYLCCWLALKLLQVALRAAKFIMQARVLEA